MSLAAYPAMMEHDRKREGLRVCRAAWLVGVSVREYREIEAGDRTPSLDSYRRICELYVWAQTFATGGDLSVMAVKRTKPTVVSDSWREAEPISINGSGCGGSSDDTAPGVRDRRW
jgi:hypothetical protein